MNKDDLERLQKIQDASKGLEFFEQFHEKKYLGKNQEQIKREAIKLASESDPTILQTRDIEQAKEQLAKMSHALETKKPSGPIPMDIAMLEYRLLAANGTETQRKEFRNSLIELAQKNPILSPSDIDSAATDANLLQYQKYQLSATFPSSGGQIITGQGFFGRIGNLISGQIFGKSTFGTLAKIGATITSATPIGALVSSVGSKILVKLAPAIKRYVIPAVSAGIGFAFFGIPGAIIGGGAGYALTSLATGTSPFTAASNLANGAMSAVAIFTGITVAAISTPIIIVLVTTPVAIALILFIINSGAYIVAPSSVPGIIENPYIGVEKKADPAGPFENSSLPLTVTYTIKITAKKGSLENISFQNNCQVIKEGQAPACAHPIPDNPPETISPLTPFEFKYDQTYNSPGFIDTFIDDTFTVTATVAEEPSPQLAAGSATIKIGNPPVNCPIPGGRILWGSYTPGNENQGHGSNAYWNEVGNACSYSLPQTTGCFAPTGAPQNVCAAREKPSCSFYGYALDVFPRNTTDVIAPTINGEDLVWQYNGVHFSNGGGDAGYSYGYSDSSGRYAILLTHINSNPITSGIVRSGEKIGSLYNQGGNTHLHLEFQVNGIYQKPENYFCR